MTDIFFSYRSTDRERIRPIRDALVAQGFDVFWDQQVPSGVDWDTWIRQHLTKSKCALVFWSLSSVASDNVRHEATVSKMQGKLIQVLLEPLTPDQFPMGLYSQQGVNLSHWAGDTTDDEWRKAIREIESKLTPVWAQRQVFELDAELTAERARREGAENRVRALQAQIAKEVQAQEELKRERTKAVDDALQLKSALDAAIRTRSEIETHTADLAQRLSAAEMERQQSISTAARTAQVREKGSDPVRITLGSAMQLAAIAVALVVGFGVHTLTSPQTPPAPTLNQTPISSQTSAAPAVPQPPPMPSAEGSLGRPLTSVTGLFTTENNREAYGDAPIGGFTTVKSADECELSCQKADHCKIFSYRKSSHACFLYTNASLRRNDDFNTGVRK